MKEHRTQIEYDDKTTIAFPFQRKVMPQVLEICAPLFQKFNLCFFSHHRNFHDGTFTSLMSNVDVTEFYLNNKYKINFSSGRGYSLESGYYIAEHIGNNLSEQARIALCQQFNLANFFYIIEKRKNYDDMFAFATRPDNNNIINTYINDNDVFNHFLLYYKDQAKYLLQQAEKICYGSDYFFKENTIIIEREPCYEADREMPLKKVPIQGNFGEVIISKRELECWKYLVQNYTFKEIGQRLELSNRTVETYVNNLKNKLGCDNTRGLLQLANILKL